MNLRGFHHLAIQVVELEKAARFYREVLGMKELVRHRRDDGSLRAVWVEVPGGGFLALEACSGAVPEEGFRRDTPGLLLVALRIEPGEREAWLEHFGRHGVDVVHQTRWSMYVRDPEGNRIALSHHPHDPEAP
jgi:catechol 2,3-dioxygenase-like lactoylglutathione lyase family enzyme